MSCNRRGGTGHTSLTSGGPPRVPLKPEWCSEHTHDISWGPHYFLPILRTNRAVLAPVSLSTMGLHLGLEIRMLAMKAVYTFCLSFEASIYSLSLSFCTSYHSWGPGSPKSSWWPFTVCSMVSSIHMSNQVTSQGHSLPRPLH